METARGNDYKDGGGDGASETFRSISETESFPRRTSRWTGIFSKASGAVEYALIVYMIVLTCVT